MIEAKALRGLGLDPAAVGRQPRGDGAILALPGGIPKEVITTDFVEAIRAATLEYDADCEPEEVIRLRLSLNAGEALDGDGEWAGQPVIVASRLVDSPVIRRVLAASTGFPLALIISAQWYDAVIREGYAPGDGYQEVRVTAKSYSGTAWVRVPGRSRPLGLLPEDAPGPHRPQHGHAADPPAGQGPDRAGGSPVPGYEMRDFENKGVIVQGGNVNGNIEIGNTYHGGTRSRDGR